MKSKITLGVALVAVVIATLGLIFPKVQVPLGSVVGPELLSPFFSVNEVRHEYRRAALVKATTTPCAVKAPNATSTLLSASVQIRTSTTTATTWHLAEATTAFATTTNIAIFSLGSGDQGTLANVASTTAADGLSVISPNNYVVWGVAGIGNLTSDKLLGTCQAEFLVH